MEHQLLFPAEAAPPGRSCGRVCGLDEAGRGPLAGPVYAAAALLPEDFPLHLLDDSKKLTERRRDEAAVYIKQTAAYGIAFATHTEIDELNILQASLLAMRRAYHALLAAFPAARAGEIVVDGLFDPWAAAFSAAGLPPGAAAAATAVFGGRPRCPVRAVPKADALFPSVMAASILAKTARDAEMRVLARQYPAYRFEQHKGYPTKLHRQLLAELGPSPVHRKTFRVKDSGGQGYVVD